MLTLLLGLDTRRDIFTILSMECNCRALAQPQIMFSITVFCKALDFLLNMQIKKIWLYTLMLHLCLKGYLRLILQKREKKRSISIGRHILHIMNVSA